MIAYTAGSSSQLLTANAGSGSTLFSDSAALGGADVNGTSSPFFSVLLNGSGLWNVGDTVEITGIAMALIGVTENGTFTFDIRQGAGGTGASATAGLVSLGTATADFTTTGTTSTYFVNFDSPISFVADANSTSIVINWGSTASMRWKKEADPGAGRLPQVNYGNGAFVGGDDSVRFSVAGKVTPALDSDMDGLPDIAETGGDFAGGAGTLGTYNGPGDTGTFFNNSDSDGDGISDGQEVNGEITSGFNYTSDPTLVDSDNDLIEDFDEVTGLFNVAFMQPTNPSNRDSDNDGLGDAYELANGLNPRLNTDFDADTFSDFDEVMLYGSDPKLGTSFPGDGTHPAVGSFPPISDAGVANLVTADLTPTLGTAIINEATTGGNIDATFGNGISSFVLNYPNAFPSAGSAVSITGFAWPVIAVAENVSGDVLLQFFDPGADGVVDGIDKDVLVGTAKGTLTVTGSTTIMYWNFTPIDFTSSGTALMVKIQSTSSLRIKAQDNFATGIWYANDGLSTFGNNRASRFSIGGTVISPLLPSILTITRSGTTTDLTWDLGNAPTVTLQRSTTLGGFTNVPGKIGTTDTTFSEISSDPKAFFRLAFP